ncbi:MAG: ABC transporter substrate-binding protein [Proteobacteria bacterium]|nr:ABC transporter substrate-binding protein [Pseudomonadota bacterium]
MILAVFCQVFSISSFAEERSDRARALISDLAGNAKTILSLPEKTLDEREQHLIESIGNEFHIPFISQFVVGPGWDNLSDQQRADFLELFEDFFLRAYSSQLGGYPDEELVIVSAAKKGSKDSFVMTKLRRPERQTVSIRWRVREFQDKPQIIDLWIDGTSVALTHREGFHRVLSNDGIDGLINLLKIRAERLSAQPSG